MGAPVRWHEWGRVEPGRDVSKEQHVQRQAHVALLVVVHVHEDLAVERLGGSVDGVFGPPAARPAEECG